VRALDLDEWLGWTPQADEADSAIAAAALSADAHEMIFIGFSPGISAGRSVASEAIFEGDPRARRPRDSRLKRELIAARS
jgi:hypothetical protein